MSINKENLQKAIAHMKTVDKSHFDMSVFTSDSYRGAFNECSSVGCTVGHCSVLEENREKYTTTSSTLNSETFDYLEWSRDFFGIDTEETLWDFMFSEFWFNSKKQAIRRMKYVLKYDSYPAEFSPGGHVKNYSIKINKQLKVKPK